VAILAAVEVPGLVEIDLTVAFAEATRFGVRKE
jgi:hypothetical protein